MCGSHWTIREGITQLEEEGGSLVTRGCTPFWQPNPNQPTHPTSSVVQIENRIGTYLIISFLYYISLPDWMYIRGGSGLFVGVFRVLRPDWVPTSTTCMSANPEKCPQCTSQARTCYSAPMSSPSPAGVPEPAP